MTGRDRVLAALNHRTLDRIPRYIWCDGGLTTRRIEDRFGTYHAFLDHLDVDMVQAFPGAPGPLDTTLAEPRSRAGLSQGAYTLEEALDLPLSDPNADTIYTPLRDAVAFHQQERGRAVFVQTVGCFEISNGYIGMEAQMMEMAMRPELLQALYRRIQSWTLRYIDNCLALGIDVIHVSDDLGQNGRMLFSPAMFREVVKPVLADQARYVRQRSPHLSLHSCGYFDDVIPDLIEIGFDCLHPIQESAGMDLVGVKQRFGDRVTIYGGLDVRSTLPSGDRQRIQADLERIVPALKQGGGFIFCTGHTVHQDCELDDVLFAYEVADELGRY